MITRPGEKIENATLIIRDGRIEAVGASVKPPADAQVWDAKGRYIYPGFIDLYSHYGQPKEGGPSREGSGNKEAGKDGLRGARYWSDKVRPERNGALEFSPDTTEAVALRGCGITLVLSVPEGGILSGTGALVTTGDGAASDLVISEMMLEVQFNTTGWDSPDYPGSLMGVIAQIRQSYLDADWHEKAHAAWAAKPTFERPEYIATLATLSRMRTEHRPLLFEVKDENMLLRASALAKELGLPALMRGSNYEYRRLAEVAATGWPVILPVDFPKAPAVKTQEEALNVSLADLRHWYLAPACAGRLVAAGVKIAFTADGLKDQGDFLKNMRKTVERGLAPEAALAALTTQPAQLAGMDQRYGSIAVGKAASFVILSGELFDKESEVLETWVEGTRYVKSEEPHMDLIGTWSFKPKAGRLSDTLTLSFSGKAAKPSGNLGASPRVKLDELEMLGTRLTFSFSGDSLGLAGVTQLSATVDSNSMQGTGAWPDGVTFVWSSQKLSDTVLASPSDSAQGAGKGEGKKDGVGAHGDTTATPLVLAPRWPDGDFGFTALPLQAGLTAFTHATIWTCGPQGVLKDATLIVSAGKVVGVGSGLATPSGAQVVDATGLQITPGLIDCHSHSAIAGDVNEGTQTITSEVRIGDVLDPDDIGIYWELAGGLTVANLLHGSANAIGGQNQVIKLRWGASAEELKFAGAPPGIKFALGENPKQSNWGDRFTTRYPQTRMGVEEIIRDALVAARDYKARRESYKKKAEGLPPRQDLELDALVEVLDGRRLVHCHSYRQDEILMLMRLAEEFGFRVASFQHVLEGYKVADRLKEHGAGASSFSDWWAYKFEVYDAIPYNGALMHDVGVVVSFNSDSGELARRLNTEAAKAVKYGGVSPEEALKFVTLNPAIQLGIDKSVGSLEPGKDADFAVWSGDPLSTFSLCRQTWIDGRLYFDRDRDRAMQDEMRTERALLIQKVLESKDEGGSEHKSRWGDTSGYSCHGDEESEDE